LLGTLRDSIYPSHREWAVNNLATLDGKSNPQVVQALLSAAREDPAASVRASCVRGLARMKVTSAPALAVMQALKGDADPRVRMEVDRALTTLAPPMMKTADEQPVLPVSGVSPQ
jgi:hypothetical protein